MMRIAITADPELPVPPRLYGGIERVIDMLIRGLVQRGHHVTLFANAASEVPCTLVPYAGRNSQSLPDTVRNALSISSRILSGRFDVVHSFGRVAYMLPLLPFSVPKLMTYQRAVTPRSVRWGHRLSRGTLHFSAISEWMMEGVRDLANWHLVYNGVPVEQYRFIAHVPEDAPLVFLGRIEEIKGTHIAIEVARRAGRNLVIAGNVPDEHRRYFEEAVKPHIDGQRVEYIGPVDDAQKSELLGRAAALLMPILWDEPFGIVMAEAMACGTPVLGLARGAVPEVVEEGVTGFVREDADGLVDAMSSLPSIDRRACRQRTEALFSDTAVVDGYLAVYSTVVDASARDTCHRAARHG